MNGISERAGARLPCLQYALPAAPDLCTVRVPGSVTSSCECVPSGQLMSHSYVAVQHACCARMAAAPAASDLVPLAACMRAGLLIRLLRSHPRSADPLRSAC